MGVCIMCLLQINKKKCLHCGGTGPANYCEKCYQELIAKNSQLQLNCIRQKEKIEEIDRTATKVIGIKNNYIKDLEYIRDCYYKEIAEREKSKKIFRLDKLDKPVTESEKMATILNEINARRKEGEEQ